MNKTILLIGLIVVLLFVSGCELIADDEQRHITHISTFGGMENFDADPEIDGINLRIQAKGDDDSYYSLPKGTKIYVKITKDEDVLKEFKGEVIEFKFQTYNLKVPFDKDSIKRGFFEFLSVVEVQTTVTLPNGKSFSDIDTVYI